MVAGAVDTAPFCGSCGFDYTTSGGGETHALDPVFRCDACGADLQFTDPAVGPPNAPSVPNATPLVGQVSFSWTASPATFPCGYQFRYTVDGGDYTYVNPATSPIVVGGVTGLEVCGELSGCADGKWSAWSAPSCATGTA